MKQRHCLVSRIAAALTALLVPAVMADGAGMINVRDFGAKGDGIANDASALNRAVAEGARLGPGTTVLIPKGTYLLEHRGGGHLNILDARGLTVQGERGAVLVAKHPDADIVRLANCTGTTLKQLVLEQEKTYFTQGTIDAMAADGKSCDVTIDLRYDEPDAAHLVPVRTLRSFSYADTTSYRQDRWWPTVKSRTRTGERKWRLEIEGWALVEDMVGRPFVIWDDQHSSHGVNIEKCSECLIEDVTYYGRGVNAGLYIVRCPGTITMRRFNILTPPGSGALLSCSGRGQMVDCRGSLVWDDCWFDKVDDDGADVFTGYNRILKQIGPRTLLVEGHRAYATNDLVAIMDWPTRVDRHQARIASFAREQDGNTRLTLDRDVTVVRVGPGSGKDWKKAMDDGVDRVVDYNLACASVTFRHCRIQSLRARALNLKAQNCRIEGCTFYDCEMPAIAGGPEFWWGEGPALHNFTVRSNTFINCNTRGIDLGAFDAGKQCAMRENRNILIEGNTFKHWGAHPTIHRGFVPQCPIAIAYSDGVTIRNNSFEDSARPTNTVKVLIQESERVTLDGNRNLLESAIERR